MTKSIDKNDVVVIKLDRPRFIRFGHKALKKLGALTGKGLANMEMEEFDLEELEKILYCGLLSDAKENNETLKLEDMEDLLDCADSYQEIIEAMNKALTNAFGQGAEKN
jgi:hypothetical protein